MIVDPRLSAGHVIHFGAIGDNRATLIIIGVER